MQQVTTQLWETSAKGTSQYLCLWRMFCHRTLCGDLKWRAAIASQLVTRADQPHRVRAVQMGPSVYKSFFMKDQSLQLEVKRAAWFKGTHPSKRVVWKSSIHNSGCRVVQRNPSLWKGFVNDHYLQFGVPGGTKGPIPLKGCMKHQYSQFGAPGGTKAEKDHGFIQAQHWTLSPHPDAKPLHQQQHRLPIEQRIKYKIACLCYQIISGTAPQYLAEPFQIYVPARSLHSSSGDRTFRIPTF